VWEWTLHTGDEVEAMRAWWYGSGGEAVLVEHAKRGQRVRDDQRRDSDQSEISE